MSSAMLSSAHFNPQEQLQPTKLVSISSVTYGANANSARHPYSVGYSYLQT